MSLPVIRTPLPGPKAKAIIERDSTVVSPSYTRGYPLVIERGSGCMVEDVDGNVFLDCAAGIAVNSTGHSHPEVVKAIVEQSAKFLHMSGTDFYYEPQVRLAEEFEAIAPFPGPKRSFFSNSGTEAIEAAIKLARYSSKRFGIVAFLGSFHGRTLGSLSLTSSKITQRRGFGPPMPGTFHAPYANCYRCPVGRRPESCAAECLEFLEEQVLMHLVSPDARYDMLYLSNYAHLQIRDELTRIEGVGAAQVFGAGEYSMRVWLDPERLAYLNLTPGDVVSALREQNLHDTSQLPAKGSEPAWPHPEAEYLYRRTSDGSFNDLNDPAMGRAGARFGRNVPLCEAWPDKGEDLMTPSPRVISNRLLCRQEFVPARTLNLLAAAWIQFMTHDWFDHGKPVKGDELQVPLDKEKADQWP